MTTDCHEKTEMRVTKQMVRRTSGSHDLLSSNQRPDGIGVHMPEGDIS